jgi:hypothetical protein
MSKVWLTEEQKRVIRRYATTWQLWREGDRSFASLEYDMAAGCEVLGDGIAVDRKARHGITADAGDPNTTLPSSATMTPPFPTLPRKNYGNSGSTSSDGREGFPSAARSRNRILSRGPGRGLRV